MPKKIFSTPKNKIMTNNELTVEDLKRKSNTEIFEFIREKLAIDGLVLGQFRHNKIEYSEKEHRRFEMSGFENKKGEVTLFNNAILNEFAYLGIYDYTKFLFVDFYKGSGTLYLRYFNEEETLEWDLSGWGTVEIIHFVFNRTIFSGEPQRRRD